MWWQMQSLIYSFGTLWQCFQLVQKLSIYELLPKESSTSLLRLFANLDKSWQHCIWSKPFIVTCVPLFKWKSRNMMLMWWDLFRKKVLLKKGFFAKRLCEDDDVNEAEREGWKFKSKLRASTSFKGKQCTMGILYKADLFWKVDQKSQ